MDILYTLLYICAACIGIAILAFLLYLFFKSPFKYPYCEIAFDVSGKRSPNIEDYIDGYLNKNGIDKFVRHKESVEAWKQGCQNRIKKSLFKRLRTKQFEAVLDDENMICFALTRKQTRYKQVNYEKSPYYVTVTVDEFSCDLAALEKRYSKLAEIGFECSLSAYHSKEQRKLMTAALRKSIAERDNYTCQICGKYMPDGVGLHIDHIVPVKKGGKSVPSNLRVLCSKCNGRKSSN